jgi:hypothetical protein
MYNMATKPSKRLYESKPISMRDREIMELLDEDLKAYKEVYKREFHQARLMNESYAPPNRFERAVSFQIDKYFSELQQAIDLTLETGLPKDSIAVISLYSQLVDYIDRYTSKNSISQRDIAIIEEKFDRIEPTMFNLSQLADYEGWKQSKELSAVWHMITDRVYRPIQWEISAVKPSPNKLVDRSDFRYKDSPNMPPIQPFAYNPPKLYEPPARVNYEVFAPTPPPLPAPPRIARPGILVGAPLPIRKASKKPSLFALEQMRVELKKEAIGNNVVIPANFDTMKKKELVEFAYDVFKIDKTKKAEKTKVKQEFDKLLLSLAPPLTPRTVKVAKRAAVRPDVEVEEGLFEPEQGQAGPAPAPQAEGFGRSKRDVEENVILTIDEKKRHRSKRRHKKDRFAAGMFGGWGGDTEGEMGGLPAGFNNALKLRPMDRAPVKYYDTGLGLDGKNEGLTLEDKMQFLNQLDRHSIPDEENEWKLNSTQNLRKAMEKRIKKMK